MIKEFTIQISNTEKIALQRDIKTEKFNQKMRLLLQNLNIFNVSDNDIGNLLLQSLKNPIKNINEVPVKGRLSLNLDSSSNLNETLVFNGIFNIKMPSFFHYWLPTILLYHFS